ncbi:MAG TPA: 6-bladed beta-propeller [Dehalococcoidia bacterium]|nr:6-bladed beta-propeller [Dehalococcoidia bacterium]
MPYGSGKFTYELVNDWAKLPSGASFLDIGGISIDAQDRVFVLNRSAEHPVMVFDREGNFLTSWGKGLFKRAHGSGIGPDGAIYCTDDKNHTVRKFSPEGKVLMTLGNEDQPSDTGYSEEYLDFFWSLNTIARGGPPFNRPTGVSVTESGTIYVADGYGNARVHKFTPDGKLLLSWGGPGYGPGEFRLPHDVFVDKQERVWIPDRENSRIQIFDSNGKFLDQWENVFRPTDVFIDDEGIVYVSELCLRFSIFSPEGELLARWATRPGENLENAVFIAPHTVALDSRGDIYVGEVSWTSYNRHIDRGPNVLRKFVRK